MSVLLSPSVELALVSRLRRAGCVFAEEESHVLAGTARTVRQLAVMVARRSSGVPLEHVVGWASFCDRRVEVDDMVFVPRRRTELLVHQAARLARRGAVVLDLCCGSGAVGASVARLVEDVHLVAVDIDPAAVRCARRNVAPVGGP
jgi:release factor glutamine methyltransferase